MSEGLHGRPPRLHPLGTARAATTRHSVTDDANGPVRFRIREGVGLGPTPWSRGRPLLAGPNHTVRGSACRFSTAQFHGTTHHRRAVGRQRPGDGCVRRPLLAGLSLAVQYDLGGAAQRFLVGILIRSRGRVWVTKLRRWAGLRTSPAPATTVWGMCPPRRADGRFSRHRDSRCSVTGLPCTDVGDVPSGTGRAGGQNEGIRVRPMPR
ncbi:hypothetical protein SAFG77S_00895 [Streptomyces afghaniensis]